MSAHKVGLKNAVGLQQTLTPQLLQSIRLLQLSAQELEQEVQEALERNVMLEPVDAEESSAPSEQESLKTAEAPAAEASAPQVEADFDWSTRDSWSGGEAFEDEDGDSWTDRIAEAEAEDARIAALRQLALMVQDAEQGRRVEAIIDSIDDNGYLTATLPEIAEAQGEGEGESAAWLEALRLVQSVEPSGFGARDLRECLLLQLDALPAATPGLRLARQMVEEELHLLGHHSEAELARRLDVRPPVLHKALQLILSLNPKPGASLQAPSQAALPDVIVSGRKGQWRVELNPELLPRLRVNSAYERCLSQSAGGHKALKDQLAEARWLVRGIEMRHETLLKTAQAIFERQLRFLELGEEGMAPLNMREVADRIGMHESTVCRVVAAKFVATPWGIYPLKAFFPTQIAGSTGDTSSTAVRALLRRLIDAENQATPLSDGELTALLARRGVTIARRTVAKYREAMHIPPANLRQVSGSYKTAA
jgi:RNA polymerase sigma-54 factor